MQRNYVESCASSKGRGSCYCRGASRQGVFNNLTELIKDYSVLYCLYLTVDVCNAKVSFQVADALEQPFPDGQFDLVWSMESGEHMPDKRKVLSLCKTACTPSFVSRLNQLSHCAGIFCLLLLSKFSFQVTSLNVLYLTQLLCKLQFMFVETASSSRTYFAPVLPCLCLFLLQQ